MNKNLTKIIIVAIVIIMAAAAIFAFLVSRRPGGGDNADKDNSSGQFPSGGDTTGSFSSRRSMSSSNGAIDGGQIEQKSGAVLRQLTKNPISGAAIVSTTSVYYLEKSTGHIYKIGLDGGGLSRISNTTVLKTLDSYWSPKADKVAVRYFEDPPSGSIKLSIKSFLVDLSGLIKANASGATTTPPLEGVVLSAGVSEMATSPFEDKVFYLSETDGLTAGIAADFKNKNQRKIFELPFGEFNVGWPAKDTITLLTKPSAEVEGYLYFINQKTGSLTRLLGGIKGLTVSVSSFADKIVYSRALSSEIETFLYDAKKETTSSFGIKTLPEKCSWGKKNKDIIYCSVPSESLFGKYPDIWYQGLVFFDDYILSKNVSTGETKLLLDKFGADIVNLVVSEDDKHLIFTNKKDGTLWSLQLPAAK